MRIHPGETLKELMEDRGVYAQVIALETHLTFDEVIQIIEGKRDIDQFIANQLSWFFKTGTQFWLNLQKNYDEEEE
jgi:HTH-type transcriptional regulator / antitoxin HigA